MEESRNSLPQECTMEAITDTQLMSLCQVKIRCYWDRYLDIPGLKKIK